MESQESVDACFLNTDDWTRKSILNVARIGHFSSDRAVREYCEHIWNAQPVTMSEALGA